MARFLALLAATTALSAVATSAAFADPDFVGGIAGGPTLLTPQGEFASGGDAEGYHLRGFVSGSYHFTPVLGAQGDVIIRYDSLSAEGGSLAATSFDGALHGFYRDSERFLLGGFVQFGHDTFSYMDLGEQAARRGVMGVEGQAFFDQFTAYGQLGMQDFVPETGDVSARGWFITGELRYFLTPDFMIEAHAGRSELNIGMGGGGGGGSLPLETVNVGFGAEYKLADLPMSVFGKYDFATTGIAVFPGASIDSHRVMVGLKFNMGEETLLDRDRKGASLKPFDINAINPITVGIGSFDAPPP